MNYLVDHVRKGAYRIFQNLKYYKEICIAKSKSFFSRPNPADEPFAVFYYNNSNSNSRRDYDYCPLDRVTFHSKSIEIRGTEGIKFRKKSHIKDTKIMSLADLMIEILTG